MNHEHETQGAPLEAEVARWRADLGARHFSDDGRTLRGSIEWNGPSGPATALVEVDPGESFPFAPPAIRVLDPGADVELTFHLDVPVGDHQHGTLCLWDDEYTLDVAPWRDIDAVITRARTWLEDTAEGWPSDDTCDLERYLPSAGRMVLYDGETLKDLRGTCVRVTGKATPIVTITTEQGLQRRHRGRRLPARKDRKLCWIGDLGQVDRPIRNWADLRDALGEHGRDVESKIRLGIVQFLLLEYRRGGNSAVLALVVRPVPGATGLNVAAAEAADISRTSRMLRGRPSQHRTSRTLGRDRRRRGSRLLRRRPPVPIRHPQAHHDRLRTHTPRQRCTTPDRRPDRRHVQGACCPIAPRPPRSGRLPDPPDS